MIRSVSQQQNLSRTGTPHIVQGTPVMNASMPNRNMTPTPSRMNQGSPSMAMQGQTPMMMQTPQPGQNMTPEQMQQMQQQQQMMQAQQAQMNWLMSQTALSSPPGTLTVPPFSMPYMPPPSTQSPMTPFTVNNTNIIRSINLGESSCTCAQPASCICSSVQYANANANSINLVGPGQGNDDEAGGSNGGGQG